MSYRCVANAAKRGRLLGHHAASHRDRYLMGSDCAAEPLMMRLESGYRGAGYARVGCTSNIRRILNKLRKAPR
jgi:hypothetical protein